ncbi:MAG: 23S rRNA (adenine(2503)-C(2))-methyltransferase RlmN [Candidatus Omnitrophica bacterium]|nr:23S rRNA (adenine(2503)-C(2))-methyltransferase RlmN [Candidatus Omnitrophota bacterium]
MQKENIKNLSLKELQEIVSSWEEKLFHARQVFRWIYKKGIEDFALMSDLPPGLRKKLAERFIINSLQLSKAAQSSDGTEKFLFESSDHNFIEAVSIPAKGRVTGCISTQAGCKFGCAFCASGKLGFRRNLTTAEVLDEVLYLKNKSSVKKLTHIVFMGTGEPLDNYAEVLKAIRMINSPDGLNIGARRITISTAGLIPGMEKLSKEGLQIELSVSLHAADNKTRDLIMPINKIYPLDNLISACRAYFKKTNRQVTFEYILIKGLNSDLQSAQKLGRMLTGMDCKVNLIPANPITEQQVFPPESKDIALFKNALLKTGINVTLRKPRGKDIEAACGQLRLKYEKR